MPKDWDDHAGWEAFYASAPKAAKRDAASLAVGYSDSLRFAPWLLARGYRRLWFPGCGLDDGPRAYAALGCEVWATDVAQSAVEYQLLLADHDDVDLGDSLQEWVRRELPGLLESPPGALKAQVHDFREAFAEAPFDCIVNIRAYQALPLESMQRAARVFFQALRPGGHAFFDTQNVQGERRDRLEDTLLAAGFQLPGIETKRWFRYAVRETGVPHNFILGEPSALRIGPRYEGLDADARFEADQKRLRELTAEYRRRAEADAERVRRVWEDPIGRTAVVVYNTG